MSATVVIAPKLQIFTLGLKLAV